MFSSPTEHATDDPETAPAGHASRRGLAAAVLAVPIVVVVLLSAFAWAAAEIAPRNLPIGVAGPAELTAGLAAAAPGGPAALDLTTYAVRGAAEAAIRDREIYGAIAVGPDGPVVITASGSSPLIAQLLVQMATGATSGTLPEVVDLVPADPDDPRGAAFGALALPLVLGGVALGAVTSFVLRGRLERVAALLLGSAVAGLAAVAVIQGWLGVVSGSWLANAGVLSLVLLAAGAALAGLAAVAGRAGYLAGALLLMLVGNPFSALTSAPELLPEPWGAIGQAMPLGAGGWLLRSTAFFDGRGVGASVWVLVIWAVAGLALVGLARRRRTHAHP